MTRLNTAQNRLRQARNVPSALDAACDAFEDILRVIGSYEESATSTETAIVFLLVATQAANGRDAMLFAPSLPPQALHAPASAGEWRQPGVQDLQAAIAGLAGLLAGGLGHTATTAPDGADRAACRAAAACATRIHYLLARPGP